MKRSRPWLGLITLAVLLLATTGLWYAPRAIAQGSTGYTKIASVPFATGTVTFTTTTLFTAGGVYNLEVTESNAGGESGPSNVLMAQEPTTGAHNSGSVSITAGTGGGTPTTLNFYVQLVVIPNPPTASNFVLN